MTFLTDKTVEYNYGDIVYHVTFKPDNQLRWQCVQGDEQGKAADENYAVHQLNDTTFFITWVEQDGTGVSQVADFTQNKVECFLYIGKDIIPLSGTLRVL